MPRLFYAIDMPEDIKREITEVNESLRELGRHVRPVSHGSFHLTMLFLGDQPGRILPELCDIGRAAVQNARPCALETGQAGFFPRVSFLTLTGEIDTLRLISIHLATECEKFLEEPENRPFKAHVTLARHKERVTPSEKEFIRKMFERFEGKRFVFDELILYESELSRQGAKYTPIEKFKFSG